MLPAHVPTRIGKAWLGPALDYRGKTALLASEAPKLQHSHSFTAELNADRGKLQLSGDNSLVSVVITNFNYAAYVAAAIDSALSQTYPEIEVVVVDDGSTDGSLAVIERYLPRVQMISLKRGGQVEAAMAGFQRSRGGTIVFLDADDTLLPDAVARLREAFTGRPGVAKAQGFMLKMDRDGRDLPGRIPGKLPPSGCYRGLVLRHGLSPLPHAYTSGNAWSRVFLEQAFPLPSVGWLDDYLHDLAGLLGRTESLAEPVARYRIHGANSWYGTHRLELKAMQQYLDKVAWRIDFMIARAEALGLPTQPALWKRRSRDWPHVLIEFTAGRMREGTKVRHFGDLVLAPYHREGRSLPRRVGLSLLLAFIWLLPNANSIQLGRWLLKTRVGWFDGEDPRRG